MARRDHEDAGSGPGTRGGRIAIVGTGGIFPGAPTVDDLWRVVRDRLVVTGPVPEGRWALDPALAAGPATPAGDRVASTSGGFLGPIEPGNPEGPGLPDGLLESLDPVFSLAVAAGRAAWRDAEASNGLASVDRARVGVVLGHIALPTDRSSSLAVATLGKVLADRTIAGGDPTIPPIGRLDAAVTALPGGVVARDLGLGGGSFTLDAACASSLYAVKLAVDALLEGRADAMLAGGLSRPSCLFTQVGFSRLKALSPSGVCSALTAAADGLVVGEGAGVLVLRRLEDAERDGATILGVIAGIGLSSDVGGNLLAPNSEGQLRAMRAAYRAAGWEPADVDLIECHATGTPVGDAVELASLSQLWAGSKDGSGAVLGAIKANIGHTLTAAGSAGLLKVLLALREQTLPPSANLAAPAPGLAGGPFRLLSDPEPWPRPAGHPRRAAVSGFGFGGINAHVLVEEYEPGEAGATEAGSPAIPPEPIAIVGMDAHFGPWAGLDAFGDRVLGQGPPVEPGPPSWWGAEDAVPGYYVGEVAVPVDAFRIPPRELREMLPQGLLMLRVAAGALADSTTGAAADPGLLESTGVFVGADLDPNTTNFHLRWWLAGRAKAWAKAMGLDSANSRAWVEAMGDAASPPLDADRTLGALGGVVASRVAREFRFGGPAFLVAGEEGSGLRAIEVATRWLRSGAIDRAVVGAVDLAGDLRSILPNRVGGDDRTPGEGAAAVVLKRASDADRDGDRVYALIRGVGAASAGGADGGPPDPSASEAAARSAWAEAGVDPRSLGLLEFEGPASDPGAIAAIGRALATAQPGAIRADAHGVEPNPGPSAIGRVGGIIGQAGATSGLAALVRGAICLDRRTLPPGELADRDPVPGFAPMAGPQPWLTNREDGPRLAAVAAVGRDGNAIHVVLEESSRPAELVATGPGVGEEGLFVVEGDAPADLIEGLERLRTLVGGMIGESAPTVARAWWELVPVDRSAGLALAIVARDAGETLRLVAVAEDWLARNPARKVARGVDSGLPAWASDRLFYDPQPVGPEGSVAFVFPGSGNAFAGMGRDLAARWPEVVDRQGREVGRLRDQIRPDLFWDRPTLDGVTDPRALIAGQVAFGAFASDLLRRFGVEPSAAIGYSLGESAALFALRAWTERDAMDRRLRESPLFWTDLTGPRDAARRAWGLAPGEPVDWAAGVVACPADRVRAALEGRSRVDLLIVNTPAECVIGGQAGAVESVLADLGAGFFPLHGVSTVHCAIAREVEPAYRALHLLETEPPPGVEFYGGAIGRGYEVDRESAADAIVAGALGTLDFPALIERAYGDGVLTFIEVGPGGSCSRMIGAILGARPHLARSAAAPGVDAVGGLIRLLASLAAQRVPMDLAPLHRDRPPHRPDPLPVGRAGAVRVPVGGRPFDLPAPPIPPLRPDPPPMPTPPIPDRAPTGLAVGPHRGNGTGNGIAVATPSFPQPASAPMSPTAATPLGQLRAAIAAGSEAHGAFLRFSERLAGAMAHQVALGGVPAAPALPISISIPIPMPTMVPDPPALAGATTEGVFLDRAQCLEYAVGSIAAVLGDRFAEVDAFPTRVRLPDEPLMLVDRVVSIEGEPGSLGSGSLVTEHDVFPGAWYLDADRVPICIAVEAGQADLLLSGYLGIDARTRGEAVYRLLDARVTFHRGLPRPGEVIRYAIRIDHFFVHAGTHFFRFGFDGTIDGEPLITMRDGCAGFFTAAALAAGKGVVRTALDLAPRPGVGAWDRHVPVTPGGIGRDGVEAIRAGDLAGGFGAEFSGLPIDRPLTIPGGRMRLIDRVTAIEPGGGRYGLGRLTAEADIAPDDWFLTCHFVDDRVMPGTLMFECGEHALRLLLLRMGCVGEAETSAWEPVPGVASRLECRGQVTESTKVVAYEVTLKELGYRPEPYAIADVLMFADGRPVVRVEDMAIQLTGATRDTVRSIWDGRRTPDEVAAAPTTGPALFGPDRILAYAVGKPSEGFGDRYKIFDEGRVLARLPGPPYLFMDRVTAIEGAEPWVMAPGAVVEGEYDVPADAWYFGSDRSGTMPFAVLLEVALQPCGWMAAYLGSALLSPVDVHFRNLGGSATLFEHVGPDAGTLAVRVELTRASHSGGMILQHFDLSVRRGVELVYQGTTYFGFFPAAALAEQVGIREAVPYEPSADELARGRSIAIPDRSPFPDPMLRMVDRVDLYIPDGGPAGLGFVRGTKAVDPDEWFFKAHFYQDPVCPGSLGLESFLQLLKVAAVERWGPEGLEFGAVELDEPHRWTYRGQVLPTDRLVTVEATITAVDEDRRMLRADGWLRVDGRTIYGLNDFTLTARRRRENA